MVIENRNGRAVTGCVTEANGLAERAAAAPELVEQLPGGRITLGADRGYDTPGSLLRSSAATG